MPKKNSTYKDQLKEISENLTKAYGVIEEGLKKTDIPPENMQSSLDNVKKSIKDYSKDKSDDNLAKLKSNAGKFHRDLETNFSKVSPGQGDDLIKISDAAKQVAIYQTGTDRVKLNSTLNGLVENFKNNHLPQKTIEVGKNQDKVKIDPPLARIAHKLGAPYRALKKKVVTQLVKRGLKEPETEKLNKRESYKGPIR